MLDFTSALYLGLRHPSSSLHPWAELTLGRPAALASPPGARTVAQRFSELVGCESGTLVPSTLHLFWDLFDVLASDRIAIYMDTGTYAIAKWGVERAAARGVPVRGFPHHDPHALSDQLQQDARGKRRPVVVADGLCPACGGPAPVAAYLQIARRFGGYLVLDDTQALGILGHAPGPSKPYGQGGGGSLRWHNLDGPDVLLGSSLAKGFGVPVAVLTGSKQMVQRFEDNSATRVHCSPPSAAVIHAAKHALLVNQKHGDVLRLRLARIVRYFRQCLMKDGFDVHGGLFPVQTLESSQGLDTIKLHAHLLQAGVRTVLHRARHGYETSVSFLLTALHTIADIDRAVRALVLGKRTLELHPGAAGALSFARCAASEDDSQSPRCRMRG